ncbi:MAG: oxygen-independent coproporphyrinogen III oxidase [Pseudomonadales bacterium]|nr:oxygen-independent coproporphyrinogen III oxidase [Pseudomonadales bacterium]
MYLVKNEPKKLDIWDEEFIKRHDVAGPRYTSYPTALQFHEEFSRQNYLDAVERSNNRKRPLSIYVHLPFCESLCYYCACNKVITKDQDKMRRYLDNLIKEIEFTAEPFAENRPVYQMHWGGGTPTYFDGPQLTELWYQISRHFHLVDPDRGEFSIEIDPRTIDTDKLGLLKGLGFNRLSFGIQDFDEKVQKAINRIQPLSMIEDLVKEARDYQYDSLNFDLIYGLPHQTVSSVNKTIEKVIDLSPDRISLFNYAHLPQRFKSQGQMNEEALPLAGEKLQIMCAASSRLVEAGYVYVGMDHFAKPTDELSIALKNEQLHRNFQGYTTFKEADLIAVGVSSISQIDNVYCQNSKSIRDYEQALIDGESPIVAGVELTPDDEIRRDVIMSIICHNKLNKAEVESAHGIDFDRYFEPEEKRLAEYADQGLLEVVPFGYQITPKGRLTVRKVCMVFDSYLSEHAKSGNRFSRII